MLSPDGLIYPVFSTDSPFLPACCSVPCQLMPGDELLGCRPCSEICGMPWLTPVPDGFWGQSLSRSKSVWPACRAVFQQHCTYWQRGKLTWSLQGTLARALELISLCTLLSNIPARRWRLAHSCEVARGKDRRMCQQGPAGRTLVVHLANKVLQGEPQQAGTLPMSFRWNSRQSTATREGTALSTLSKQAMHQPHGVQQDGKCQRPSSCSLHGPAVLSPKRCWPSSCPALSLPVTRQNVGVAGSALRCSEVSLG